MKKIFAVIIILALPLVSKACDTCNCGTGNQYIGILPDFNKYIFGLRYYYSSLHAHIGAAGSPAYFSTLEKYNTAELWGGWNITHKIRIISAVPYKFEELSSQAFTTSKEGLGDIYLLGYYNFLNTSDTIISGKLLLQNLWFGAGIEIPTGKYDSSDKSNLNESANLYQLGSGSTDILFDVMYVMCLQDVGLNVSSMYKINTVNKYGYEYGNRFNINVQAYYKFSIKHRAIVAPDIGILFENYQHTVDNEHWIKTQQGNLIMGTVGFETNFKTITIGGNFQISLQQSLGKGTTKANNRCILHISFSPVRRRM